MTYKQRYILLVDNPRTNHVSLWTQACRAQGWNRNDRALRLAKFGEFIGREIESATDVTSNKEIDRLFAGLRAAADNLAGAQELYMPEMGDARRLCWKIEETKSQLMAYVENVPAYVAEIIKDKFNRGRSLRVEVLTENDLKTFQLRQLLVTLTARLSDLKKQFPNGLPDVREPENLEPQPEQEGVPF